MNTELPQIGSQIGDDFVILSPIGKGGCGMVYEALQKRFDRSVALKVMRPGVVERVPNADKRFLREIDLVKRLEHPNIIRLYDFGVSPDGLLWMAMEFVRGQELTRLLKDGALSVERTLNIALQALSGLAEAHKHTIVHRDLTPGNIMLTQKGADQDVVKLLDFGIGKALGEFEDPELQNITSDSATFSTPRYTAPEVVRCENVGAHSDVYAMGLVLYEMLLGRPAMAADTVFAALAKQISYDPDMPSWLEDSPLGPVIRKAIAKDWKERYPDAYAFHAALKSIKAHETHAPTGDGRTTHPNLGSFDVSTGPMDRSTADALFLPEPPAQRNAGPIIVTLLLTAIVVLVALLLIDPFDSPSTEKSEAPAEPETPIHVAWELRSVPSGAAVVFGDAVNRVLCQATPCEVLLETGTRSINLRFELAGYAPTTAIVIPSQPGSMKLTLAALPPTVETPEEPDSNKK